MSPVTIFRLNTLKGTTKAPAVDLLRLNTQRGTKTAFLTPKRYDEHPRPFYMPPPPPPGEITHFALVTFPQPCVTNRSEKSQLSEMQIIPLNLDSVLLLLQNSKLAPLCVNSNSSSLWKGEAWLILLLVWAI